MDITRAVLMDSPAGIAFVGLLVALCECRDAPPAEALSMSLRQPTDV